MAAGPQCAVVISAPEDGRAADPCLEALLAEPTAGRERRIILVGNAGAGLRGGGDDRVELVAPPEGGFAAACNAGAGVAGEADSLVFLDGNATPSSGWLDALLATARAEPAAAVVGPKLLDPDGTVASAGIAIGQDRQPRHLYAGFAGHHPAVDRPKRVAAVAAACLLVRRDAFERVGGFDPQVPADLAALDLCLRLGEAGYESRYCPRSVLHHAGSQFAGSPVEQPWRDRLVPDDVEHYLADGLISISYGDPVPRVSVSPLLAAAHEGGEDEDHLAWLLSVRSRQVMELRAERASLGSPTGPVAAEVRAQPPAAAGVVVSRGDFHRLGAGEPRHRVSVLMPVKDAAPELLRTLPRLLVQRADAELEIVAVDSGSTDGTVEILEEFKATVVAIDPAQFDHGLTRNLVAEHARAEVLIFLNGRSRPLDDRWLAPLLSALDADPGIAGACSRVVPHEDADLLTRRDVELDPSGSARRAVKRIDDWEAYRAMPVDQRRLLFNFHTVSAAIRADVLERIPFRSVRTIGEDLLWAREVLEAGMTLVHEPGSRVYHSHDYSLRELFMRNVDDGIAHRDINDRIVSEGDLDELVRAAIASDWHYLREGTGLAGGELELWQIRAALRRVAQGAGQWLGTNYVELPVDAVTPFSRVDSVRGQRR
jgi:GT2 family glycosyltransferase